MFVNDLNMVDDAFPLSLHQICTCFTSGSSGYPVKVVYMRCLTTRVLEATFLKPSTTSTHISVQENDDKCLNTEQIKWQ